ncbi:hypothetical protein [Butyrivibrio sp. WCD3002]|uniref:hypothetical protein n=1 Tax=Butyrivibrio sp. WCD3002 TaxID=1280676 RepID=UPI0003FCCDA5|nr:hypothetical protein [Butyrivibrio sp. WCD3002]
MIRSKSFIKKAIIAATLSATLISGNIAFNLPAQTVRAEAEEAAGDIEEVGTPEMEAVNAEDESSPLVEEDISAEGTEAAGDADEVPEADASQIVGETDAPTDEEEVQAGDSDTVPSEEAVPAEGATPSDEENPADAESNEDSQDPAVKNEATDNTDDGQNTTDDGTVPAADAPEQGGGEGNGEGAGEATTEKPTLTLRSKSLAKVYDGKALVNGDEPLEVEEGWLPGDGADYNFTESITTGHAFNSFEIIPWEGTDLNDYNVDLSFGDLTVIKREGDLKYILTVTGVSGETKYNGSDQTLSGFIVNGRSYSEFRIEASGDPNENIEFSIGEATFTVSGISASVTAKDAGTHFLNISGAPVVRDASGADVTDEFSFEYFAGKLTINPREVILKSASDKKKYDGKVLENHEVTVSGDGFVDGEGVTYKFTGKQKEVGESFNYFTYVMNDGTLESNYDITVVPGKLKVKEADKKPDENNTGSDSQDNESGSDSGSSGQAAAKSDTATKPAEGDGQNGEVLGARRADEIVKEVLGARNSATDDMSDSLYGRVLVMAACIMLTTIIWGKMKKHE